MISAVLENVPGSAKLVSSITTVTLVLVFHSPLAGEAEMGSGTATNPKNAENQHSLASLAGVPRPPPHIFLLS
jgi:hypothetical protein